MNQELDFRSEVELLLGVGKINRYMASYLLKQSSSGLDESLWQEALEDAMLASEFGVESADDFKIFFYIDHFAEDLIKDMFKVSLSKIEEDDLKKYMFSIRHEINLNNLVAFRAAVLKWMQSKHLANKTAHPNIAPNQVPLRKYNLDKWYELVSRIKAGVISGQNRIDMLRIAAGELSIPERYDFLSWYNYYSKGEDKKYNINNEIKILNSNVRHAMLTTAGFLDDETHYYIPKINRNNLFDMSLPAEKSEKVEATPAINVFENAKKDEQRALDFESGRNKLMSRTFAIDKLLEKYRKVLSAEELSSIEDTLNELRKKVRKLKFATSISDAFVKTANIFSKHNFKDGAELLIAIAENPLGGVPDPAPQKPTPEQDAQLQEVANQLETISAMLKNRELVRSLAKVDLLLHDVKMAVFFPEINEAQAKLIEAFGYASNRIDDVLPKIKGSVLSEQAKVENSKDSAKPLSTDKTQVVKEVNDLAAPLKSKHLVPSQNTTTPSESKELMSPIIPTSKPNIG